MTQANQIQKSDEFKLVIVFRIEGKNSRAMILRLVSIAVALAGIAGKLYLVLSHLK